MKLFRTKQELQQIESQKLKNNEKVFVQLELRGIGFKIFSYKDYIAFDLGTSNLLLLKNKNDSIILKVVKNNLYVFSEDICILNNFCESIISLVKRNKYKGKGIFDKKKFFKKKSIKIS